MEDKLKKIKKLINRKEEIEVNLEVLTGMRPTLKIRYDGAVMIDHTRLFIDKDISQGLRIKVQSFLENELQNINTDLKEKIK